MQVCTHGVDAQKICVACVAIEAERLCGNSLGEEGAPAQIMCTRPDGHTGYCSHDPVCERLGCDIDAAIAIGSAVLPSLINLIREGLDSGLSEEEATRRALERMAAAELPKPLTQETRDAFAAAHARLDAERAKSAPIAPPMVHEGAVSVVRKLHEHGRLSEEERRAIGEMLSAVEPR